MIVNDLEGNEYKLQLKKKYKKFSKLHQNAVQIVKDTISGISIYEDVPVKIKKGLTLYLDIYLPILNISIEVHGSQHYKFNKHFHKYQHRFGRARLNDELKKEWCQINHIGFLELAYNERGEWEQQFRDAVRRHTGRIL